MHFAGVDVATVRIGVSLWLAAIKGSRHRRVMTGVHVVRCSVWQN